MLFMHENQFGWALRTDGHGTVESFVPSAVTLFAATESAVTLDLESATVTAQADRCRTHGQPTLLSFRQSNPHGSIGETSL